MWCFNIQPERCLTRILKATSHLSSALLPQARDIGRYVKTRNNYLVDGLKPFENYELLVGGFNPSEKY